MTNAVTVEAMIAVVLAGPNGDPYYKPTAEDDAQVAVLEDAIREGVIAEGGGRYALVVEEDRKVQGVVHAGKVVPRAYAVITPKKSIRIMGVKYGVAYDRTFEIGDVVEYDSFNLSYTGPILAIDKSGNVSCSDGFGRKKRLNVRQFTMRNHDLDLGEIAARNAETSRCI